MPLVLTGYGLTKADKEIGSRAATAYFEQIGWHPAIVWRSRSSRRNGRTAATMAADHYWATAAEWARRDIYRESGFWPEDLRLGWRKTR